MKYVKGPVDLVIEYQDDGHYFNFDIILFRRFRLDIQASIWDDDSVFWFAWSSRFDRRTRK